MWSRDKMKYQEAFQAAVNRIVHKTQRARKNGSLPLMEFASSQLKTVCKQDVGIRINHKLPVGIPVRICSVASDVHSCSQG